MKTLIILQSPKKTVYELGCEGFDVELDFNKDINFVVCLPDFYKIRAKGFKSEERAVKYFKQMKKNGYMQPVLIKLNDFQKSEQTVFDDRYDSSYESEYLI